MASSTTGEHPAEVTRVICASVSRVQGSVMTELFDIRNRLCDGSGPALQVSAALLYSSGWFVIWLEGPQATVEEFVQRAARDRRNAHQKIIHRSRGPATLAEGLTVTVTQGVDGANDFGHRVMDALEEFRQGGMVHPATLWQRLSAPCSVGTGRRNCRQLPDRHIALVAAQENGPIDIVRKLGDRFGSRVVYQRFASAKSHSSDVGVAYVDIASARHVRRIQLLSRRALGHHTVRQSLTGLDGLVLLLGSRPDAAIELAASVAACVRALRTAPAIYLVNGNEEIAQSIASLLRQHADAAEAPQVYLLAESYVTELLERGTATLDSESPEDYATA